MIFHLSPLFYVINVFVVYRYQLKSNRIYDGVEAETRKSQASFQII